MNSSHGHRQRSRTKVRHHRRIRLILLCLGSTGLLLSAGLGGAYLAAGKTNPRLLLLGGIYLLASLAILLVRAAMTHVIEVERRKHSRRDRLFPVRVPGSTPVPERESADAPGADREAGA
jgi:hypothetical protein